MSALGFSVSAHPAGGGPKRGRLRPFPRPRRTRVH
jgi:hypothetical protein